MKLHSGAIFGHHPLSESILLEYFINQKKRKKVMNCNLVCLFCTVFQWWLQESSIKSRLKDFSTPKGSLSASLLAEAINQVDREVQKSRL